MFKGYAGHWAGNTKQTRHEHYFHVLSFLLLYFFLGFLSVSDDEMMMMAVMIDGDDNDNNTIWSRTF